MTTHHPAPATAVVPVEPSIRDAVAHDVLLTALMLTLPILADVPLRVLDIGGGDGFLASELARRGHHVTVLDPDICALDRLRARLHATDGLTGTIELVDAAGEDAPTVVGAGFDLTCCHDVLPHVPDPTQLLRAIAAVTLPGAVVSLTGMNAAGMASRPAGLGRWEQVLRALTPQHDGMRVLVPGTGDGRAVRADHLTQVESALAGVGVEVTHWYGRRVFTDARVEAVATVDDRERAQMVEAEWQAAQSPHYRATAPYWHVLGRRSRDDDFAPTVLRRRA